MEKRLLLLGEVFSIDICAYAVMHNHTHVVLHVNILENMTLTDLEVLQRWARIRNMDAICMRYLCTDKRPKLSEHELIHVANTATEIRAKLNSISWFMSCLNQYIARKANKEDECTGRFWEGRFKSQALMTQNAVLACMAYVDLNPIRAGISQDILDSSHTSIRKRTRCSHDHKLTKLFPVVYRKKLVADTFLHKVSLNDYVKMLSQVSMVNPFRDDHPVNMGALDIDRSWIKRARAFETEFAYVAGTQTQIISYRKKVRANMNRPRLPALRLN
ncbi:hypothetical protein ACFO4O_00335 [Glaciecola siphonariae]|uniref:Transposase n=1 Tax=Glaciecola siphonariae TaxID=521012 RepID=A0ABV9LQZ6_9ALTE